MTREKGEGSASGKSILIGEHFVVHGCAAMAIPIPDLRITVRIQRATEPASHDGHLGFCLATALAELGGPSPDEVAVALESDIPIGVGMGSSAALSVAVGRAVADFLSIDPNDDRLRALSMTCERRAHGNPSGLDTEVCLLERPIWVPAARRFEPLADSFPAVGLILINTGPPEATTAELVAGVGRFKDAHPDRFDALFTGSQGRSEAARSALLSGDHAALGRALHDQHGALKEVGVSTDRLDAAVAAAMEAGALGAKLSGAGGGGLVIALAEVGDLVALAGKLRDGSLDVIGATRLGQGGLR